MKVVASTDEYTIYQRRDERYAVRDADRRPINGAEKVAILLKHELIVAPAPKAPEPQEPEAAEEAAAEDETAAEGGEEEGGEEEGGEEAAD